MRAVQTALALVAFLLCAPALSQTDTEPKSVDQRIDEAVAPFANAITNTILWGPSFGQVLVYTPLEDFPGSDSFQYTIENADGETTTAQVQIVSSGTPSSAERAASGFAAGDDTALLDGPRVVVRALANDIGEDVRISSVSEPLYGTVSINPRFQLRLVVLWLVIAATIFTLYFRFINIRGFGLGMKLIRDPVTEASAPGEVTHFQALTAAVSGTVGLGNIAGVAVAVTVGGPGATFWMITAGLLGMASKFTECTLGVRYREVHEDGTVSGGPMHYLGKGIGQRYPSLAGLGKVLAAVFAVFAIGGSLGGGNMFQANQSFQQLVLITGGAESWFVGKGWLVGLILAFLVGIVIVGGIKSIASVTSRIVPFMAAVYVLAGLFIIAVHIQMVPAAFQLIVESAFSSSAVAGGAVGVLITGFQRAAFSNEAGIGSAAIAHSAVKTNYPATEGLVALYEPFIDTVVVCTITALVIIITGSYAGTAGLGGIELTSSAFESVISWFPYVLSIAVFLFAYSTMISWSYYGVKAWQYLFGHNRPMWLVYKLLFLSFIVLGASTNLSAVVGFSDAMILAMSFPNIIGLYLLMPEVRQELRKYLQAKNIRI